MVRTARVCEGQILPQSYSVLGTLTCLFEILLSKATDDRPNKGPPFKGQTCARQVVTANPQASEFTSTTTKNA